MKIWFLLFSLLSFSILAQTPEKECHKIFFAGVEIGCLKNGSGPFTVHERVAGIKSRLTTLSQDSTFDPSRIYVLNHDDSSEVLAIDLLIVNLHDADLGTNNERARATFAHHWAEKMRESIHRDRKLRSPKQLSWSIAYTLLATIGLALLLKLFSVFFPLAHRFISTNVPKHVPVPKIKGRELFGSDRICSVLHWITRASRLVLTLLLLYIYIPLVLSFYSYTANLAPKLYGFIIDPLETILRVFVAEVPNIFFVIMIAVVARYVIKLVKLLFWEIERGTLKIDGFYSDWAMPTFKLVRVLIIVSAFIMAFPYLPGSSSPAFQGVSVFIGVLLSLGSTSAVANVVAGVVITYMRPFRIGDRVKIAETLGDVVEKTLLVTRIRTIKNVDVTIPNSMVLASHIINYSSMAHREGLIIHTTITMGYETSWRIVHEVMKEAALKTEFIDRERQPFIFQTALNDFAVSYELNAYTKEANKMATIISELHRNLLDGFNERGIEVMAPHYTSIRDGSRINIPE